MTESTVNPVVPVINRTSFANSTVRALAESMVQQNNPLAVNRRWGVVQSINANDTLNVTIGGSVVNNLAYDANYTPIVGETVYLDIVGADVVVMGTMSPSLHNPAQRRATVTSISADRETVNVTVDDGTLLTAVPVLASYDPVINDQVHLSSYRGAFVVIGSLDRTAQTYRRAVGDIEPSLTVKPGTLALNGQVVSRTDYAQLWAWVQANSLVAAGMFTAGDGTTTFGLPNFAGRTLVGAGTLSGVIWELGTLAGANDVTLATAQMPAHNHGVTVADHATHTHGVAVAAHAAHSHSVSVDSVGSHSHSVATRQVIGNPHDHDGGGGGFSEGPNPQATGDTASVGSAGGHSHAASSGSTSVSAHSVTETAGGPTTHTVGQTTVGGTTPVDIRQPSIGVNYVIWF